MTLRQISLAVLAAAALTGCAGRVVPPELPLIDAHSHVFNSGSLPIDGFLRAKGVPKWLAWMVRRLIDALTADEARLAAAKIPKSDAQRLEAIVPTPEDRLDPSDGQLEALGVELRLQLEAEGLSGPEVTQKSVGGVIVRHLAWALLLTRPDTEIAARLLETYPEVKLFTPCAMDMEFWFEGEKPSLPYAGQLDRLAKLVRCHEGKIHPFVAFDPERQRRSIGTTETGALELVQRAIEEQGFLGVKVYPPLGYRPSGNARAHDRRGTCPFPETRERAEAYDRALEELYAWCEREGVPIAAHCEDPGAESRRGCGTFADPAGWEAVLAAHPRLRLNLMHFGGVEDLLDNGACSWAWEIGRLMQRYDHVYADVGAHEVPTDPDLARRFFAALERLFKEYPRARGRLMFGTDWHLLVRHEDHEEFPARYIDLYSEAIGGGDALARFAAGAAVVVLGLRPGDANSNRMERFWGNDRFAWITDTSPPAEN